MPPRRGPRCRLRNHSEMIGRWQPPGPAGRAFSPHVTPRATAASSTASLARRSPRDLSGPPAAAVGGEAATRGAVSFDARRPGVHDERPMALGPTAPWPSPRRVKTPAGTHDGHPGMAA
jgi:hypothetical protein